MNALALLEHQTPEACPECSSTDLIRDYGNGEVVCSLCGLVVDVIVDRSPEYAVYEPEQLSLVRATPMLIPALSDTDFTLLTRVWKHPDPETRATMHRLRHQQSKTGSPRGRHLYHAKNMLFKLGDKAKVPRGLLEQAADLYRRAYNRGLVRGRTIHGVMAGSIYATYRLQRVPRTIKELAGAMDIEAKELTRVYRLLHDELGLRPERPKAEDHIPRLAEALSLSPDECRLAMDVLREARRLKHTLGKDPRSMAAAAVYVATLDRPHGAKVTQAAIAEASGVTEVTIRNRYRALQYIAATLFPSFPDFPSFPVSPVSEK